MLFFPLYIHAAIVCPSLLIITNGTIYYSPNVSTPYFDLGTNATYTCEAEFYLEGNEVQVCMDDDGMDTIGMWSGQEPSCVRKLSAKVYYCLYYTNPKMYTYGNWQQIQ